ncbi:MAG: HAD hydrolase family protein [Bacillota bacterium]|nr:HAD hydrolase family protein [Bacillota bacterium]
MQTLLEENKQITNKKLILIDVAGTIQTIDGKIPESAIQAIRKARSNGHLVFLVTRRAKGNVENDIFSIGFDGMIGGGGSYIEYNGQILKNQVFALHDLQRIVAYLQSKNLEFYIEASDGLYGSYGFTKRGVQALEEYGLQNPIVTDVFPDMTFPETLVQPNAIKINYILESYDDYLDFKENFPEFKCNTWGGKEGQAIFGDCLVENIKIQSTIEELADFLEIAKTDIISIGDSKVDIPMFEASGLSICMGSGCQKAKEAADWITRDTENDGLYHALEHFNII